MIAASGYFVGLRQTSSVIAMGHTAGAMITEAHPDHPDPATVPVAVRYIDENWSEHGPNQAWRNTLLDFRQIPASTPESPASKEKKLAALGDRANRRAYDGAPPMVPHPVPQASSVSCLACHGQGLQVKDRFASKISHPAYGGSCTQCHVSMQSPVPSLDSPQLSDILTENSFQGRETPANQPRAWPGAPPVVPHRTLMRNDCMSCHGPNGLFALRTPHPERQSCTQCHVPSADNDQRQFVASPALDALNTLLSPDNPTEQKLDSAPVPQSSKHP